MTEWTGWTVMARVVVFASLAALAACDMFVDAGERIRRAESQMAVSQYRNATIELQMALKDEPGNKQARLLLAQAALYLGDPVGAEAEIQKAREFGATGSETGELAARIQIGLERYRELLAYIDDGQIELKEPLRSVYRGHALLGMKRPEEAATAYEAALKVDSASAQARTGLAEAHAALGRIELALGDLDRVIADHPDFAYAWLVKGAVLSGRGQFKPAEEALQTAVRHAPLQLTLQQRAGMLASLVQTRLSNGDLVGAQAAQKDLAELSPEGILTRLMAGRLSMARQDYQAASAELQRLLNAAPEFLPARFLLGAALAAQDNLEQAEMQLAQVVRGAPANVEARKLLAEVRLRAQRPEAAMQALVPALEGNKPDPEIRTLVNVAQSRLGEDVGSIELLERSVTSHPDNDELKVSLASAYLKGGQRDKALELLRGSSTHGRLALARLHLQEKQLRKADEITAQLLAAAPDRVDLVNLVGLVYLEAGYYDRALGYLRTAADRQPENAGYWVSVARAQLALNQSGAAREAVEMATALAPEWLPAAGLAAMLDVNEGRIDSALRRVAALKAKSPQDSQVLMLEGDVRLAARQYKEAADAFESAGRLRPSSMAALKAFAARQLGSLPDATDPLRRWLQREPNDAAVRFALAEAYQSSDPAKAITEYERVLQQTPRSAVALNNLAWLYHTSGDKRGLATARKAHELAPGVPAIADTYGWILLESGRVQEAVAVLRVAAQGSDNAEIQAHYAEALKRARANPPPL